MTPKEQYEDRKRRRKERIEALLRHGQIRPDDERQTLLDMLDMLDRLTTSVERIAEAMETAAKK